MNKNLIIFLCILFIQICFSCKTKEAPKDSSIRNLQQSIFKFSSVANKIDEDMVSLWAYSSADSIAKSMELKDESLWRDLARAYSALSYIAYGMSYSHSVRSGDVNNLFHLPSVIVECNPDTIMPNKYLHLIELKSDYSFIFFYDVSHMERTEDMKNRYQESLSFLEHIYSNEFKNSHMNYQEITNNFMEFQRENKNFFFIYSHMLGDLLNINCKSEEVFQKKRTDWMKIANEMDSLPSEWNDLISKQITLRAKLINLISSEIQALE